MRHKTALAALVLGVVLVASAPPAPAIVTVQQGGMWPKDWLPELERVRAQATSIGVATGTQETIYQIPLRDRDDFAAVWPAVLSAKSPGGTLTLCRVGRETKDWPGVANSGPAIRLHMPPGGLVGMGGGFGGMPSPEALKELIAQGKILRADAPWPESAYLPNGDLAEYVVASERDGRKVWLPAPDAEQRQGFVYRARVDIDLVVDGMVVDLNKTHLPEGTSIIDKRDEPQPPPVITEVRPWAPSRPAMPDPYGWGLAEEGLQLGLFPGGDRRELSYGDTVELVTRARNVGSEPLDLCYSPPRYTLVSALPGNRLRLEIAAGRESQYLRLEPGEEKVVPGLELRLRVEPPGDRDWDPAAGERDEFVRLLPGQYDVELPYPIWTANPTIPNLHQAHRAHPGMARFAVRDDPANPWIVERVVYDASGSPSVLREMPADPGAVVTQMERSPDSLLPGDAEANGQPVAWGGFVNGLQAGLRQEEWEGPAAGPERPGRLTFGYYVRNCTNRPLLVTMADLGGSTWSYSDWSPYILDSEGNHVANPGAVDTGWREQLKHALAPGQCLRIASPRLRLVDAEKTTAKEGPPAPDDRGSVPEAKVRPGRYTVSCTEGAQWAAGGRVDMVLQTGRVAFEVTAEDLGRARKAATGGGAREGR